VSRVNFAVRVGTVVPRNVRVAAVPAALIAIYPAWRGYQYVVVEDEVIIVDRSRRIVAVIDEGPGRTGSAAPGGAGSGSVAVVDLSPDEIREVQLVLIQRGFLTGQADGQFGPRTRAALIAFQRSERISVTGRIDARTVTALGVSGKVNVRGGASDTTTGQGPDGAQSPRGSQMDRQGARDRQGSGQQGSGQQGSGQTGAQPDQPTTGQGMPKSGQGAQKKNGAPPSTTGQGGSPPAAGEGSEGGNVGQSPRGGQSQPKMDKPDSPQMKGPAGGAGSGK
jgi:peptidoglycan hydrolase-like protein with peptidoglycan-binding domain